MNKQPFPTISQLGVLRPERYVFQALCFGVGALLGLFYVIQWLALEARLRLHSEVGERTRLIGGEKPKEGNGRVRVVAGLGLLVGLLGLPFLGLLSVFDATYNALHDAMAVVFFLSLIVNCVSSVQVAKEFRDDGAALRRIFRLKQMAVRVGAIVFVAFAAYQPLAQAAKAGHVPWIALWHADHWLLVISELLEVAVMLVVICLDAAAFRVMRLRLCVPIFELGWWRVEAK